MTDSSILSKGIRSMRKTVVSSSRWWNLSVSIWPINSAIRNWPISMHLRELYDSTLTVAKQLAEKDKFRLQGEYRASSANEIRLGSMNVPGIGACHGWWTDADGNSDYSEFKLYDGSSYHPESKYHRCRYCDQCES